MNSILLSCSQIFGLIPLNHLKFNSNIFIDYIIMISVPLWYLSTFSLKNIGGFGIYHLTACGCICSLAYGLFIHLGCFLYMTTILYTFCRRKQFFIEFKRDLEKIDKAIAECWKAKYGSQTKNLHDGRFYYSKWFLTVVLFCLAIIYEIVQTIRHFNNYFFFATTITVFPYFISCIGQGQFIHYVSTISNRFKEVNEVLNEINKDCTRNWSDNFNDNDFIIPNSNELMQVENLYNTEDILYNDRLRQSSLSYHIEEQLVALFKLHGQILSLSRLTNSAWAPQCVSFMVTNFVINIAAVFLAIEVIVEVAGKNSLIDYVVYTYIIWSVVSSLVVYTLLYVFNNTNNYSNKSIQILHEITQNTPVYIMENDFNHNRVKAIILQFLQWEKYFQFNGIGLFVLDYTFIFSVIGSAASYLIVLLQIDITPILKADGLK